MSENVVLKRPRQLWTAIIVLYLQAVLNAGGGALLLFFGGGGAEALLGFGSLLIGFVLAGCAVLLTRGVSWARFPVIVVEVLGIIGGAIAIFSGAIQAVAGLVLSVLVLVNMFNAEVRLWLDPVFAPASAQTTPSDWADGRIARVLATSRAAGDPPLSAEQEAAAARLVQLGPSALGGKRNEVRAIGEELSRAGGVPLMRAVLHRAEVLSLRQNSVSILREVEMAWNNIGDWMG
ncbi:hypothetical protein [Allorhizocola rhizosphaerae]|uniref:hypothetical protein n=1 Tax=Allorhizocola rhizosphaerae TaxID=1872709 RepID=UPI000E3D6D45|nr:hypothetical protein [Allorhizocola rhizosphaerae]